MPIYTDPLPYDGHNEPLYSSIGIGPRVTKAIDKSTKAWLDEHPEATTTVEDESITTQKLHDGSVTTDKIATDGVKTSNIEDGSVTTPKIADLAVTTPKIANGAVTAQKLASDAIDAMPTMTASQFGVAKVGPGLAITNQGKLELDGDGDIATAVTSWLNAHPEATTTVQDGAVTTAKLANGSVTTAKLVDGAVTDAKLAQSGGVLEDVSNLKGVSDPNVFSNSTLTVSGKYINSRGISVTHQEFARSDFIESTAGVKYTVIAPTIANTGCAVAFYSDNTFDSFISGVSLTAGNDNVDAVAPEGTRYVIFSYRVASGNFKCVATVYDSLVNISNDLTAKNGVVYYDNSVLTIAGKYIKRNGRTESHADFSASDFIKSAQGAAYTIHAPTVAISGLAIAFYADNVVDSFISGVELSTGNDDVTVSAPAGTKYVRFSYRTASGNFNCSTNTLESLFNTSALVIDQIKAHKSFSVIGDSYSAYPNWVPSGQSSYYPSSSSTVSSVSQMWWYLLAKQLKWNPLIVDAYSGTTVCTHVRSGHSQDVAYVNRVVNTMGADRSLESKPDYIFVLGGQNDYVVGAEVGDVMYSGWTDADLYKFAPAFCYLIDYLMTWNPGSVIINISNTGGVSSDMADKMETACAHYGIINVKLANISKELDHPTATGMESICSQVIASIR